MKTAISCASGILFTFMAFGQEVSETFVTRSGTQYTGVSSVKVAPNGLTVTHDSGVSKVSFYDLTDEQIQKYGLKLEEAENFTKDQNQKLRESQAKRDAEMAERDRKRRLSELDKKFGIDASGTIFQVIPGQGILFKGYTTEKYLSEEQRPDDSLWNQTTDPRSQKRMVTVKVQRTRTVNLGGSGSNLSFVECGTDTTVDGESVSARLYPCGNYSYVNSLGHTRTIPKFTNSLESFIRYLETKNLAEVP